MNSFIKLLFIVTGTFSFVFTSCDDPSSSETSEGRLKLSIKSTMRAPSNTFMKPAESIQLTSAKIVIKEIEVESSLEDSVDFELEEPFIQDLAVDSSLHEIGFVNVPFGSYEELEIEISKLDDDAVAFNQHPELQYLSVYVEGTFNDTSFVFTSDIDTEQEREFVPALVLDENSPSTNLVLYVNLSLWFIDENGNPIDPNVEDNKDAIENNIKDSFDVFEDEDDDGEDDDDDDD